MIAKLRDVGQTRYASGSSRTRTRDPRPAQEVSFKVSVVVSLSYGLSCSLRLYMKAQDQRYNAQMQEVQRELPSHSASVWLLSLHAELLEEVLREQLMDHLRNTG